MRTECEEYQEYMTKGDNTIANHRIYKFPNGWGASVICGFGSYGLELMPINFDEAGDYSFNWEPFGYLTDEQMEAHLKDIFENGENSKREEV
ncbi:hypothetical protein P7D31_11080 [Enterococcus dongliensis]|uniref:hypothetical protein n=1 Tax=Enterococcus dongliensis TaxID=2559925 RepID=UPI002890AD4B|nr:hypothetical protein [Enterococcus dongliensis]MDT2640660.1 hypothetical protein [Enterococcus dongliensis]